MALPSEVRTKYITIIDDILSKSDLTTIGEKRIRRGIQERVEYDITPQKVVPVALVQRSMLTSQAAISELILQRFDIFNARQNGTATAIPSIETTDQTNGHHEEPSRVVSSLKRSATSDDSSDVIDDLPAKKKRMPSVDDDAAFAARLQAEEDKLARPTRNGAGRKTANAKKKRTPKKKTSSKVTGSDDSDINDAPARKINRETGFHKPLNLSPALSALFDGETALSRPQVTKRIWQYIKGHDLQDPGDKRFIICDDQLHHIFKQDKVHMFTMTKLLNQQMYATDE